MSVYGDMPDLEDPGFKSWVRGTPGGGNRTYPGGSPPGGGGGFLTGGGLVSGPVAGAGPGGEAAALRALLRKRLLGTRATPLASSQPNVMGLAPWQQRPAGGGMVPGGGGPGGMRPPDAGVIPPGQRTGDTTDRSYNDPRVAPFVGLDLLIKFLQAGSLGPTPGGLSLDVLRDTARSEAEAGRQRNDLIAQSMDVDPATRASYALRSGLQGQSDVSRSVNDAVAGDVASREAFGRQLLQQLIAGIQQQNIATSSRGGGQGTDWGGLISGVGRAGAAFGW